MYGWMDGWKNCERETGVGSFVGQKVIISVPYALGEDVENLRLSFVVRITDYKCTDGWMDHVGVRLLGGEDVENLGLFFV